MADGRHVVKYCKCHNLPIDGPIWTKIGWSHLITSPIIMYVMMRLPW